MTRDDEKLRERIAGLLASDLDTEAFPRADDAAAAEAIAARLREEAADDVERKLLIGGWTDHAVEVGDVEQSCGGCMYYLNNRRWCDQPELDLPAEPDWSCRLWRI